MLTNGNNTSTKCQAYGGRAANLRGFHASVQVKSQN